MPATIQNPGEQQPLDDTMGVMYIGVMISAVFYGISLVQTAYYYNRYPNDPWYLKYLVAATLVLDTIHLACITHTIYHYTITAYYVKEELTVMVWSVLAEAVPTGVSGTLVQCFYTVRVWQMSKKNYYLAGLILIIVFTNAACGTAWVIISLQMKTFTDLLTINPLTISINALSAAADVLIAASLCITLYRAKTGFKRTDTTISILITFSANTGLATSMCAMASLISLLASPETLIYALFYFCIGRLYTNSLLVALNTRKAIRGTEDEHKMVSIPSSVVSPPTTHKSRSQNLSVRIDTTQEYAFDSKSNHMTLEGNDGLDGTP
ncbi:hypothetical protein Moror_2603 [Moniliophthora roreri MCA 2997]|uniref:DUF6534 domain-containing protein n=2 Tax=Moniliophthora roreri TaxID=221103 RepID=V2YIJ5_MONRO|nr:hypothetical protein Moror_2603 [Moniliophthora roreri MCA 2997]